MSKVDGATSQLIDKMKKVGQLEEEIKLLYKTCKTMVGFPLVGEIPEDGKLFTKEEIVNQSIQVADKWLAILTNFNNQMIGIHNSIRNNIHLYQNEVRIAPNNAKTGVGFGENQPKRKIDLGE